MPNSILQEIGQTGLENFAGSIRSDFLKELRGKEGFKHYNEMRLNSPIISALLLAIEQPLRSLSWTFASDDENDPRAEFLDEARAGMSLSWNDHITEALTMLPFGYSIFEILYKVDQQGRYVWRKFAPRGQDTVNRWLYDDTGGLSGFEQLCAPTYKPTPLPIEKLLIYRTRVERGSPEGRSILRSAWIPYYYCKHIQQIEAIGTERDLAGLPVITLPQGADTTDNDTSDLGKARSVVRNIRNDEQAGIVLPSPDWKLELLSTGGSRAFDTDKIIRRYESRMLMAALAQFLMLGQDSVGSLALSKDQTDFFTMSINSVADNIAETFTKYAIPRLLALNGMDVDGIRLEHTPPGDTDLMSLADFLQKTGTYLNWSAEDEVWLRQMGGLPERSPDDIKADMEAKNAARDAALLALKEKQNQPNQQQGNQQQGNQQQPEEQPGEKMSIFKRNRKDELIDAMRLTVEGIRATQTYQVPAVKVFNNVPDPETWKPPDVIVNVPQQAAPVVNVTVPEQPAPQVTVNIPAQAAPIVTVNVPEQKQPIVNVAPASVTVQTPERKPRKAKVTKSSDGSYTLKEE